MSKAVEITRLDYGTTKLPAIAARTEDGNMVRRRLAIALVLHGQSRADAAKACGMDRQTLRDWVIRFNESGVDGLRNEAISLCPPSISAR